MINISIYYYGMKDLASMGAQHMTLLKSFVRVLHGSRTLFLNVSTYLL